MLAHRPPRFTVALVVLLLAVACQRSDTARPVSSVPGEIPATELSDADPAVREQVEAARARLSRALEERAPAAELAAAWGELARLYHAYELDEAAAACYRRARELAPGDLRWSYLAGALAHDQRDLPAAEALLRAALQTAPEDPAIRLRLGEVLLLRGEDSDATSVLAAVLEAPEYEAAARVALGERALAAGDPERAVEYFRRALELQPEATRTYVPLARALRAAGRDGEVDAALARRGEGEVRRPDPLLAAVFDLRRGAGSFLLLAARASSAGRLDEAERIYREALATAPDSLEVRQGLAGVLAVRGDLAAARRLLDEVVERDPSAVDARIRRARLLRRLGDPGGAVADYLRVLELRPELLDARLGLASARLESGSPAAALAEFERVLEGSPDHLEAQVGRASALAALGRRPEARRAYEEVLAERPEDASARLAHAILLAEEGLTGRAEAELGALLDSAAEPELRARAAHNLGNLAAQRRAWDEARGLFERALELDPGLLPARLALGTVLLETGEPARAAAEYRAVADRQPHSLAPRLFEIQALAAAGRLEEAHRRLAEAREVFGADDRLEATAAWLDRSAG